ncbi:MAG: iron-containing alcohol dehydrogenase [Oscillospiraceae bacterium]|nr:iron-containing alcohol dehydrogenase [Oscillospiraceae bacterium]
MSSLKTAYYRTFQAVFNIGARVLPWRKAAVVSGAGAIEKIPALLSELKVAKPLVVTDPGLMAVGVAPQILKILEENKVSFALFAEVEANPSVNTVNAIYDLYRESGCDGVIAIGGGSPMDAAKAAAARVVRPRKTVGQLGGLLRVRRKLPPFIAVPTTAGTGSETTIAALITDTETHYKYAIMDLSLIPRYAVLDPALTVGLPPSITAATGMDALTHAVEAYLCWTYNTKESIRFAEEAVEMIFRNLPKAYADGGNLEARTQMLIASYKAGFAFTRAGVGNIHAVAHTLGGLYNTPHGLANAVILPIVLEDYGKKIYPKLARLAAIAGVATGGGEEADAKAFIAAIRQFNADMDIPAGFDFILDKDIPEMARRAGKEANPIYPVPVVYDRARYIAVIEKVRV